MLSHSFFARLMRTTAIAGLVTTVALTATEAPVNAHQKVTGEHLTSLHYRNIGPTRGGRATAIAGVPSDPTTFYMGSTGGVFKTMDGGQNWSPISDKFMKTGSVGAIAVAPSNPSVVVVGMGESPYRGVASGHGDGIYISVDAGKSFKHVGLKDVRQISTIHIHPQNPDVIWVAAQGSPWSATDARGVYKTTDGGKTWNKSLFVSNVAGSVDLSLDPSNPKILYASMWDHQRQPWEIRSGGPASGIWKSVDGGETWGRLSNGLPDLMGKIGVVASPAKAGRVFAIIEAKDKPGVYRSDDYGETWTHTSGERKLFARSWYYMHIFADPVDADTVYIQNSAFYKSIDGGKNFAHRITGSHGDWHDFWINPDHSGVMGVANDGGAAVSFNGGKTWSTQMNQPTAQFYRVNSDNQLFYRVYGGQQDNSTVAQRSNGPDGALGAEDFHPVAGCESAHLAFDPDNPTTVYGGCYLGQISRWESVHQSTKNISLYPEIAFGVPPKDRKYRFNWNAPIVVSTHDRTTLYHAGNVVAKSTDRGESWDVISGDLTRNDPKTLGPGGRPITNEVSENYGTILALTESPHDQRTLWAGSDDGLVHVTTDGGIVWRDVTPNKGRGKGMINSIEVSPHDPNKVFAVFTGYKYNDHKPYIWRSTNGGGRWKNIATKGFRDGDFVRVVREDPIVEGLLYAGTETGVYISFDDGKKWQPLQNNLPHVPVTDIHVRPDDLVLSTQGRAFWVLDDLAGLRAGKTFVGDEVQLTATDAVMIEYAGGVGLPQYMKNEARGAMIQYWLPTAWDAAEGDFSLDILDAEGKLIRSFDADKKHKGEGKGSGAKISPPNKPGLNRFVWDFAGTPGEGVKGLWSFGWNRKGEVRAAEVAPGTYQARLRLKSGPSEVEKLVSFEVTFDPRHQIPTDAWDAKAALQADVDDMFMTLTRQLRASSKARKVLMSTLERVQDEEVKKTGEALETALKDWEASVISADRTFFQDVLNWPDLLVSDLAMIRNGINGMNPPITSGMKTRLADVKTRFETSNAVIEKILGEDIPSFNALYRERGENVLPSAEK